MSSRSPVPTGVFISFSWNGPRGLSLTCQVCVDPRAWAGGGARNGADALGGGGPTSPLGFSDQNSYLLSQPKSPPLPLLTVPLRVDIEPSSVSQGTVGCSPFIPSLWGCRHPTDGSWVTGTLSCVCCLCVVAALAVSSSSSAQAPHKVPLVLDQLNPHLLQGSLFLG